MVECCLTSRAGGKGERGEGRRGVVHRVVGRVDLVSDDEGEAAVGSLMRREPGAGVGVVEREGRERSRLGLGRESRTGSVSAVVVLGRREAASTAARTAERTHISIAN